MVTKCIFISHSAKESETADFLELLSTQLKEESFDVLVDRKRLNLGDNWKYEIYNWMGTCHGALILLSKSAIEDSMWVVREVNNLLWRRTLDSNFFLIPIYFGVTPEDVKKNKLFDDLDLENYHGITDGNSEDLIQIKKELVEKLKKNHITTPLDEVAYQIATKLEGLSRERNRRIEIINNTLDKLNLETEPWLPNRDPCLVLATKMLNLGLCESANILNIFCDYLDFKYIKQIFDLLAPSWVDLRVATCVSKCALHEEHKTVVVLNSIEDFSAKMYVRRASNRPPGSWLIHHYSGVYEVDPVANIVTEIENLLIDELVSDEYDKSKSQKQQALRRALIRRNEMKKPVFISLKYTKNIAKLLPELQSALPLVTLFLLTGESFPAHNELEGLRFKFLEPPLEPRGEKQAMEEYDSAYGMIV